MQSSRDEFPAPPDGAPDDASLVPCVLLQGIEPAMAQLFEAWLQLDGLPVRLQAAAREPVALILIDLPFPRSDGAARVQRLAEAWPGVPVLALSSTFLPSVAMQGEVARQLGVAAVLASPVARDALRRAVAQLLPRSAAA